MRVLVLAGLIGLLSFGTSAAERPFRVAALYWSSNIPGQVAMRAGIERAAADINASGEGPGVTLLPWVAGDGDGGIDNQILQMRAALSDGVDAIVVQPTDNAALAGPLKEANAHGIPVVAFDQYISAGKLAAYVTSDNFQAGYLDGEYVAAAFPDDRELRVILVDYPHVSSTVERVDGFLDALREIGQPYRILRTYQAVEPVSGKAAGQAILHDFPEPGSVDVVFTVNDGGGLAVVDELAAAGRAEIFVATIDGDPQSVRNIASGRLTRIDAAQFCGPLGATALQTAYDLLRGRSVRPVTLVPVFPVTRETIGLYPGWGGPIPADFTKTWRAGRGQVWSGAPRAPTVPKAAP